MIKHYPSYPVTLDNGYQLLSPRECETRSEMVLRLYEPLYDLIVFKYVPYQMFLGQRLDEIVVQMVKDLDVSCWVMRAFRRIPRAWRLELLARVQEWPA